MIIYSARWVLPISSPAIEQGAIAVRGTRIVAVGARAQLIGRFPHATLRDLGNAAVLPGLVNVHSHAELTLMRGWLEACETDFFSWLRRITVARLEKLRDDDIRCSATLGAVEAARAGVTCLGDASDVAHASMSALRDVGLRAVVFKEVFGPDPRAAREQFTKMEEKTAKLRELETERVRLGLSPHAPYTVSAPLLELVTEYAQRHAMPLMLHAAESQAETDLMLFGRGPFAESLARRGIQWRAPGIPSIQYLARLGFLAARPLLAHCVRVDDADIDAIAAFGARVAHCPKSNAKLGHGRAPLISFLQRGICVGLGTDSVASNNTCDLLEECRFAALVARFDLPEKGMVVTAEQMLRAATLDGARALGIEDRTGSLEVGKEADFTAVALDGAHQSPVHDVHAAIVFSSSARDVRLTVVAGQELFRDGRVLTVDEAELRARADAAAARLRVDPPDVGA